jgi:prevent-host-death family protein
MNEAPQMATVADLRHKHLEVFIKLRKGPVIIAQCSQPAAVLVSVEQWDALVQRIKRLELLAEARRINADIERDPVKEISFDELKRRLKEKAAV